MPVVTRSKVWVCGHSPARVAGSNTAGVMTVSGDCCVLSGRSLRCADQLVQRSPTECGVSVWCVSVVCPCDVSVWCVSVMCQCDVSV
jgi:hypothetical protein